MAKIKSTKKSTMVDKTQHGNLRLSNTNSIKIGGELRCSGRVSSSSSTNGTPSCCC